MTSLAKAPSLRKIIERRQPSSSNGHRRISLPGHEPRRASTSELAAASKELARLREPLSFPQVEAILEELVDCGSDWEDSALARALRHHVEGNWSHFALPLASAQVAKLIDTRFVQCFPRLRSDPGLLDCFVQELGRSRYFYPSHAEGFLELVEISSPFFARQIVEALRERRRRGLSEAETLPILVWPALVRGLGWNAWTYLFGILVAAPDYAGLQTVASTPPNPNTESRHLISARQELARNLSAATAIRAVAGHLQGLIDPERAADLLDRPPEIRSAFAARIHQLIGQDGDLRQATIEALLWLADGPAAEVALFAVTRLVERADRGLLRELTGHPNDVVGYGADAVDTIVFGNGLMGMQVEPGAPHGLAQPIHPAASVGNRAPEPRTWIGDRAIELAIEGVIEREERRFAAEYEDHHSEGEERLCAMLFEALSKEFEVLNREFATAASLAGASRRASVRLRYRSVDKPEEGSKGIGGAKRFSTDVCLIVDPILDGRPLGRRASLIQAKRLYANRRATSSPAWERSYRLKPKQTAELIQQTSSSFFMFQGPGVDGRGVPIIPAQLVSDLALQQSATGAQLSTARVGSASRSLADWMTYSLLGLRVGDPYQELIDKAEGKPGARARRLLELPRVEVEIAVGPVSRPR